MKTGGLIFVISGPSGSGKTTLLQGLLKQSSLKQKLVKSISFTTRPKRSNEKNGKDYFFISLAEFKRKLKEKKILEWTKYLGYYYATPKDFIDKQLRIKTIILCLDLKGAARIKRAYPKRTITVFVIPPSLKELQKRIIKRCNNTKKEEIRKRLSRAKEELLVCKEYDYCIKNIDLKQALERLINIVSNNLKGEK